MHAGNSVPRRADFWFWGHIWRSRSCSSWHPSPEDLGQSRDYFPCARVLGKLNFGGFVCVFFFLFKAPVNIFWGGAVETRPCYIVQGDLAPKSCLHSLSAGVPTVVCFSPTIHQHWFPCGLPGSFCGQKAGSPWETWFIYRT